jgi:aspartyl/asparaginyl beta-hydroxylase (cupin superfamily)
MTTIEIFYTDSDFDSLTVKIDNTVIDYTLYPDRITIACNLDFGVHLMKLKLDQGQLINITDVKVDGAGVRMMLYMSYIETANGNKLQPATTLWENNQIWVLPFGNPMSFWQSLVYNKLTNGDFGKNLEEQYYICYPESIDVGNKFPTIVQSFFKHDFDFVCIPRSTPDYQLPYYPVDLTLDSTLLECAVNEIKSKRSWIVQHKHFVSQAVYSSTESVTGKESEWIRMYLIKEKNPEVDPSEFPELFKFINSLNLTDIKSMFIGILPPGGCIAPHKDRIGPVPHNHDAHYYVYIPLCWPNGNYFKINGAGIIRNSQPCVINHMDYVHSLVNDSNEERIVVGIRVGAENNPNLIKRSQNV